MRASGGMIPEVLQQEAGEVAKQAKTTRRAEARIVPGDLRGAEAPLFHSSLEAKKIPTSANTGQKWGTHVTSPPIRR